MLEFVYVIPSLVLLILTGYVEAGGYCRYSSSGSYYYCYGYCYGYYCDWDWYDSNTVYVGSLTLGAFIGVIIGCLVCLGVLITVIVVICASCTKSAGQRGRVVHPNTTNNLSVITGGQGQVSQYGYPVNATAPPAYPGTGMTYYSTGPQPPAYSGGNLPPPPPAYSGYGANSQPPPPNYSTLTDQGTLAK